MNKKRSGKTNSPFRYPGGKFYARKLILSCIPKHRKYCEPFLGGGSIFFAKEASEVNVLNDKDEELINCYIQIRDNVEDLISLLDGIPAKKELHGYYKNDFKPSNDLERAMRWYYLNRTSYSGIMKHQNCYWGYGDKYSMKPENWPPHLRTVSDKLQKIELRCQDFEEIINSLDDKFFVFIDPPYFNADQDKFYNCTFTRESHYRLERVLRKNKDRLRFLITYDNCYTIKKMYEWCVSILDREWNYTINRTDDQRNGVKLKDGYKSERYKGKEIFITNYEIGDIVPVTSRTVTKPYFKQQKLNFKLKN
ncbi:MAG: DNA adenine methylase [Candidatus Magnetomorum sp.]|nr:DNA adenine methylase [Candidatus Magnetomorum sp.]